MIQGNQTVGINLNAQAIRVKVKEGKEICMQEMIRVHVQSHLQEDGKVVFEVLLTIEG